MQMHATCTISQSPYLLLKFGAKLAPAKPDTRIKTGRTSRAEVIFSALNFCREHRFSLPISISERIVSIFLYPLLKYDPVENFCNRRTLSNLCYAR